MGERFDTYEVPAAVAHNYEPINVILNSGQGSLLFDTDGHSYVDMMSAYSAVSFGHGHPRLVKVLTRQAQTLAVCSRAYRSHKTEELCERLAALTGLDVTLPMNTGAEAVETAIKAARRWATQYKRLPEGYCNHEIVIADGNFHGRTVTITGFSSEPLYRRGFGPFTPGFYPIPFGNAKAAQEEINWSRTCAILIEPIQGEAGIIVPPYGYLMALRELCTQHKVLLILDEIQSGLGRTGKMFAYQHENIQPDMVLLGKALGGGLLPISAVVGTREVMDTFTPGSHGSTFGGNPLASAVAIEALDVLEDEGLVERSRILGDYMLSKLRDLKHPLIKEVRGQGLWAGVELHEPVAREVCERLARRGVLTKDTRGNVVRLAPALSIPRFQLDFALERLALVLNDVWLPN